jgi:hypothetical protein
MTVNGGSIHGFNGAILADAAISPRVENVKTTGDGTSQYGISLSYTLGAEVVKVKAKHLDYGLVIQHGDRAGVNGVHARDVTTGAYVFDQATSRFTDLSFHTTSDGIGVNDLGGARNRYREVTIKDPNANYGFLIDSPQGVRIDRSKASNTRFAGIVIQNNARSDGYGATVTRTEADANTAYGMYAVSKGTKAYGNSAEGNGTTNCFHIACGESARLPGSGCARSSLRSGRCAWQSSTWAPTQPGSWSRTSRRTGGSPSLSGAQP